MALTEHLLGEPDSIQAAPLKIRSCELGSRKLLEEEQHSALL